MSADERTPDLILEAATRWSLDPDLVRAIVRCESAGEQWATRYEPTWRWFYFYRQHAERLRVSVETEQVHQATSWGLMQIMGAVAREIGFLGHLPSLCDPVIGLEWSCRKLKKIAQSYESEAHVIATWNAGAPKKTPGGLFTNQRYVDRVCGVLRDLRQDE